MATRGPVPKRTETRRRRNTNSDGIETIQAEHGEDNVAVPVANERWHPIAKEWFESLAKSGQSKFYEASDWATAVYIAEAMSRSLGGGGQHVADSNRMSGQLFAAIMSAMSDLLTTEGSRRRARIELQKHIPEDKSASIISLYRDRGGLKAGAK